MGRILRRRESTQEDSENIQHGRLETKRKQKTSKLKGVTKENKSPALGKKNPIVKTAKRMALVDKTNKPSPPRDLKVSKDVPSRLTDTSNLDISLISAKFAVGSPGKDLKSSPLAVSTNRDENKPDILRENRVPKYRVAIVERPATRSSRSSPPAVSINRDENKLDILRENRVPKYRVALVEKPATRNRNQVRTGSKENTSQGTGIVQKKAAKRKVDDGGESFKTTAGTEVQELPADVETSPKTSSIRPEKCSGIVLEKIDSANTPHINTSEQTKNAQANNKLTSSVFELKISSGQADLPNTSKGRPIRKRKQADVGKKKQTDVVNKKEVLTAETGSGGVPTTNLCAYCRGVTGSCTCARIAETPLSRSKNVVSGQFNFADTKLEKSVEGSRKKDTPLLEPSPSCSWSSNLETPFRKPRTPKLSSETNKSLPRSLPNVPNPSLFSIFKKPDTPRRNSMENKIFVSGSKQTPSTNLRSVKKTVYANKNMTPLRRRSSLAPEQKEELYEFDEVDESEPKPKKKQRRIMKIQRIRHNKKKKPKVYVPDPEMERRLLRNLDLSPSVMEQMKIKKTMKGEVDDNQPSTSTQGMGIPVVSGSQKQTESSAEDRQAPSSDGGIYDVYTDDDHHGYSDIDPCPSSPCSKYGSSTPLYSAHNKSRDSLLDESIHRFGGLSAKVYSPVKSKPSPMPVLLQDYNNDSVRNGDSDRSVASNGTAVSGHSIYHHDLDVSASTPVKFHKHDSTTYVSKHLNPAELNVSNCFGFDEPELMEEPLMSPIKTTVYVPPCAASPARVAPIVKKKPLIPPPTQSAPVDVEEVIKKLRSEVGDSSTATTSFANSFVFDDTEISPKKKSPMKRYLQSKFNVVPENVDEESSVDSEATAAKIPRLSYERPKLRKRVAIAETSVVDASVHFDVSHQEVSDSDDDADDPAEMPFEIPAHKTVKQGTPKKTMKHGTPKKKETPKKRGKGMTKKDEEELEKWAKMFNSQCDQVENYGLCVE